MEKYLKYNWIEFKGKKLPIAAIELLKNNNCGIYLRSWQKAFFHTDENNYKNWIIAGSAPGIKVACKYTLFFHMSARKPQYPKHNFTNTTGCECYKSKESMLKALNGYIIGVVYNNF